jgi:hypothetical protein
MGDPEGDAPTSVLRILLAGSNPHADVTGIEELPGRVNYFKGNNPDKWLKNIPVYRKIVYQAIYPGINLIYYGRQGSLEYDLVVNPGGDHRAIKISFQGIDAMEISSRGELILHTTSGDVTFKKPFIYQNTGGVTKEIEGGYVIHKPLQVSFRVAEYDTEIPLIIDPVVSYSTYLGGNDNDYGCGIAVDSDGCAYVTGYTHSTDFPTVNYYQVDQTDIDAFVTKLDESGNTLCYSTYLGGNNADYGQEIVVDSAGSAYVTGYTYSINFPAVNEYQEDQTGIDVFVTRLDPSGSSLVYSTYLGGDSNDYGNSIAIDSSGCAYVTGMTYSTDFPAVYACQGNQTGTDAFVTKLEFSGSILSILYSTYLGGNNSDNGRGIAVDSEGYAYVIGYTMSTDFQTVNAYQGLHGDGGLFNDAFVTKLAFSGSALSVAYSTYLGGNHIDQGQAIAVDSSGSAYVTGTTASTDFPAVNHYQGSKAGSYDVFVTRLGPSGSTLSYSTYLGGAADDCGEGIAVDSCGRAYVTGYTYSTDFPTEKACQADYRPIGDAFVTKFYPQGSALVYSTYLGGNSADRGFGIAIDSAGNAYVTGDTQSTDFPKKNAYQESHGDGGTYTDSFVTKISDGNVLPGALMLLLLDD